MSTTHDSALESTRDATPVTPSWRPKSSHRLGGTFVRALAMGMVVLGGLVLGALIGLIGGLLSGLIPIRC